MKTRLFLLLIMYLFILPPASAQQKEYSLWYSQPAPNEGAENIVKSRGFPYDKYWERWSLPIGNGYMGACIFGRTDTERIQLNRKNIRRQRTVQERGHRQLCGNIYRGYSP